MDLPYRERSAARVGYFLWEVELSLRRCHRVVGTGLGTVLNRRAVRTAGWANLSRSVMLVGPSRPACCELAAILVDAPQLVGDWLFARHFALEFCLHRDFKLGIERWL